MSPRYDYVTLGHVTRDQIEDRRGEGFSQPGGGAFYSALQAARLGLRTLILTQGVPHEIEALLEPYRDELDVEIVPAKHTTALSTRGSDLERVQRVLAWAGPMADPPAGIDTAILHFAPVARETPNTYAGHADFIGITPQGLVRHWTAPGEISLSQLDLNNVPTHFQAAVIGEQERASCATLFHATRQIGAYLAVTAGPRPTSVYLPQADGVTVLQAHVPVTGAARQDLGAGDVFAAAFFISLWEGHDALEAATFANAAAALRVAADGGGGAIAGRERIEAIIP